MLLVYILAGFGFFVMFPIISVVVFLWGLGGLINHHARTEVEDNET